MDHLLAYSLLFIIMGPVAVYCYRKASAADKMDNEMLSGFLESFNTQKIRRGTYKIFEQQQSYHMDYVNVSDRIPTLTITLDCLSNHKMIIRDENDQDRSAKKFRISAEFQSGNQTLDDKCYIESENHLFLEELFKSENSQKAIFEIIDAGFVIELKKNKISIKMRGAKARAMLGGITKRVLPYLSILRDHIIQIEVERDPVQTNWLLTQIVVCTYTLAIIVISVWIYTTATSRYQIVESLYWLGINNLPIILIFILLNSLVLFFSLKGFAESHKYLAVSGLMTNIALVVGVVGMVLMLNSDDSGSSITSHTAILINKWSKRDDDGRIVSYIFKVEDPQTKLSKEFTVGKSDFQKGKIGETQMEIKTRRGSLGYHKIISTKTSF